MSLDLEQPEPVQDSAPASAGTLQDDSIESGLEQPSEEVQDPDEVEEELEGVKLKGKKELLEKIKNERLMQADYTRKTQEVAEHRRAIEQERAQVQAQAQFQQAYLREVAHVTAIDDRLQQFANLPWQQINAEDPQRAQALLIELNQLQAQRGQLVNSLTVRHQQQTLQAQQETARRMQEGHAVLAREIKGWGPELAGKLAEFGKTLGVPEQVLNSTTDPALVKLLYRAYIGDQLEKKAMQKPVVEPPKPVTRIGGSAASNTKPLGDITDPREWAERRRQRLSRNR